MAEKLKTQQTAERRQVTVVHVDIVNSTALVDHLDPEEVMELMQAYLDQCRALVNEHHGFLAGYTGDGFEAYFGYPMARENSAVEALNAAIQISAMLSDHQFPFEWRIGIATGLAVVDQPGIPQIGRSALAFGVIPHLATRLEQSARPGHILIDNSTMKLCQGRFVFRSIGQINLKGFDGAYEAWEVVEPLQTTQRFLLSDLSPYVGRRAEIQLLVDRWQSVLSGEGQVIVLHGDPGIGKSRLIYELQKLVPGKTGSILRFQCLNQFTSTPLYPWTNSVQRFANIHHNDGSATKIAKLTNYLNGKLGFSSEIVSICANLMGLQQADGSYIAPGSVQHIMMLQSTLLDHLISSSHRFPVFLLVEDTQWIDASTMNLLHSLVELIVTQKIMVVMTCRSGSLPSLSSSQVTALSVNKLDGGSTIELITKLTARTTKVFSAAVTELIRQRSNGNPLFIEELTKHYLELTTSNVPETLTVETDRLIPATLQGPLMERIDNAGKSKEIAQLASVIGKEFDSEILVDLSQADSNAVQEQLDELVELGVIRRLHQGKQPSYEFSHALLRDAVYSTLLKPTRRHVHEAIADYFSTGSGAKQHVPPEIIAYHYECAEQQQKAFRYWLAAGQHALRTGATEDAANLLAKAVAMASTLGETADNLQDEAVMYLCYGLALNASRGVEANPLMYFRKAEELSTKIGNNELTLEALDWQFGLLFNAGELRSSRAPAEKMKELGSKLNHSTAIASGCQGLGMAHFMLGNFLEARKEFELGLAAGGEQISGEHCYPSMTLSYLAWTLYVLGDKSEAEACASRAIESARRESPHAIATALSNCCYVYQCMGSIDRIYERTEELVEHTKRFGEQMYLRRAIIIKNWAECLTSNNEQLIPPIVEQIDFLLRSKEEIEVTFLLGILAELQIRFRQLTDAQASVNRALELVSKNSENFYLAELYRLKALIASINPENTSDKTDYLAMSRNTAAAQHASAWLNRLPM